MTASFEVVCAGIVVADHLCVPVDHLPEAGELVMADALALEIGGCASNTAVDLAKMGVAPVLCGCVGDDVFGRFVVDTLKQRGVDTAGVRIAGDAATSQTLIINVRGQDRRFIHCFGANARFTAADIRHDRFAGAKVLYVGGYMLMPTLRQESPAEVFRSPQAAGIKTVLDVAVPGRLDESPGRHLDQLDQLLPHTDVFLPNTDEGRIITGRRDPVEQAAVFRDAGAGTVVITMGGEGAILVAPALRLRAGVYPIECLDGSGGGDAFDAGFICGMLEGSDPVRCLQLASALGASCVRAVGTTPGVFTRPECDAFLRSHKLQIDSF